MQSKLPPDFSRLLRNGENKTRLIELIVEYVDKNKAKVFNILRCNKIVISMESKTIIITHQLTSEDVSLNSNQEEADTKVILHSYIILNESLNSTVTLRSPSGDTDILLLAVVLLRQFKERIAFDDGNGKNRKVFRLSSLEIEDDVVQSLIGFHAFTGNDYVSSFFRKGKDSCMRVLEKSSRFQRTFSRLGDEWELSDQLVSELEEYVCYLYGSRSKDINLVQYNIYTKKYTNENKIIDMCSLPPCRSVLKLHSMRANYVAAVWKRSTSPNIEMPLITSSGWFSDGSVMWIEDAYPIEIEDLFADDNYNDSEYEYGDEGESDDD